MLKGSKKFKMSFFLLLTSSRFRESVYGRYFNFLYLKFQILVINELIRPRVISFADYKDFKEIAESAIFSFEMQTFQLNPSTNVYINTVRQITQQESKQVLKGIAKICGILTEL